MRLVSIFSYTIINNGPSWHFTLKIVTLCLAYRPRLYWQVAKIPIKHSARMAYRSQGVSKAPGHAWQRHTLAKTPLSVCNQVKLLNLSSKKQTWARKEVWEERKLVRIQARKLTNLSIPPEKRRWIRHSIIYRAGWKNWPPNFSITGKQLQFRPTEISPPCLLGQSKLRQATHVTVEQTSWHFSLLSELRQILWKDKGMQRNAFLRPLGSGSRRRTVAPPEAMRRPSSDCQHPTTKPLFSL